MRKEILRIENVTYEEDGIIYLDNFNLHILHGEIMGLIGTNNHGMLQLVELIHKNTSLKYGRVYYNGNLANTYMIDSKETNRIYIIGQHSALVQDLTVSDNIFVLRRGFKKYFINRKVLRIQVVEMLDELGVQISPDALIADICPFERCVTELVKGIMAGASLIIVYEINEFLSSVDLLRFHEIIRHYAKQGIGFLYIASHHEEVFQICDRFCLVKDGRVLKVLYPGEMDEAHIKYFVEPLTETDSSRVLKKDKKERHKEYGILQLRSMATEYLKNITLSIHKGECVTIFDQNNETLEEFRDLFSKGILSKHGEIRLDSTPIAGAHEIGKLRVRTAIIADDPVKTMLFQEMTYMDNLCFLVDQKMNKSRIGRHIRKSIYKEYEGELGKDLDCWNINKLDPKSLYRLVYYRVLLYKPQIVFIINPFQGADMYLRLYIVDLINLLKRNDITVIIFASHIADTLAVSDRLLTIEHGILQSEYNEQEYELIKDNFYRSQFFSKKK